MCVACTYITLSDIALLWSFGPLAPVEPELVTYANFSVCWRRNWPTNRKSHWSFQPGKCLVWSALALCVCACVKSGWSLSLGRGPEVQCNQPKWRLKKRLKRARSVLEIVFLAWEIHNSRRELYCGYNDYMEYYLWYRLPVALRLYGDIGFHIKTGE